MSNDKQLGERFARSVPFSQYEYVDVQFDNADADTYIPHTLTTDQPDNIRYEVVGRDRAGDVYHDFSSTRRAWRSSYLFLRCATAGARVRLRLSVEA